MQSNVRDVAKMELFAIFDVAYLELFVIFDVAKMVFFKRKARKHRMKFYFKENVQKENQN